MPLDLTQHISTNNWLKFKAEHGTTLVSTFKQDAKLFDTFNHTLYKYSKEFNGKIAYWYNNTAVSDNTMYYKEGTPYFNNFRLGYKNYYMRPGSVISNTAIQRIRYPLIWKNWDIYPDIVNTFLSMDTSRYIQPTNTENQIDFDYIFFPMQIPVFDLPVVARCAKWAEDNKKHLVIKMHPIHWSRMVPSTIQIINKFTSYKYVHMINDTHVNTLLDNSYAVWSTHSGVNFRAMLLNKPSIFFQCKTECAAILPIVATPDAAYANSFSTPDSKDIRKFLSFYKDWLIDMHSETYEQKIYRRLEAVFDKKLQNIEEIIQYAK